MQELTWIQRAVMWALPVVFAITVHEVAHGRMALRLGDPTARMLGRLSLNPLRHVDPVGTLLVPGVLLLLGGVIFGWAKPVPVTWENLRRPRRDMALVAAAGPFANLLMAVFWALVVRAGLAVHEWSLWLAEPLVLMGVAGTFINVILLVLNLLPVPPLDGGRVATGVLPMRAARALARLEPYGLIILVALIISGGLHWLMAPFVQIAVALVTVVAGVSPEGYVQVLGNLMGR